MQFGGRRWRIVRFAPFRMRVTWSAGWYCSLLRRSPFEGRVLRRALLQPAPSWVKTDWPLEFKRAYASVVVISGGGYSCICNSGLQDLLHRAACLLMKTYNCAPWRVRRGRDGRAGGGSADRRGRRDCIGRPTSSGRAEGNSKTRTIHPKIPQLGDPSRPKVRGERNCAKSMRLASSYAGTPPTP